MLFTQYFSSLLTFLSHSLVSPPPTHLWYKDVTHAQHAQPTQLFGCVKHDGRESRGHLGVEADLDSGLYLVLTLDQQVQQLLCVHHCLSEVGHQPDQRSVPLVHDLEIEILLDFWRLFNRLNLYLFKFTLKTM